MPRSPPPRKQNYPSNPHPLEKISGSALAVQHFGVGGLGWGGGGWGLQLHNVTLSLPHLYEAYTICYLEEKYIFDINVLLFIS